MRSWLLAFERCSKCGDAGPGGPAHSLFAEGHCPSGRLGIRHGHNLHDCSARPLRFRYRRRAAIVRAGADPDRTLGPVMPPHQSAFAALDRTKIVTRCHRFRSAGSVFARALESAERKAGLLLKQMGKAKGALRRSNTVHRGTAGDGARRSRDDSSPDLAAYFQPIGPVWG